MKDDRVIMQINELLQQAQDMQKSNPKSALEVLSKVLTLADEEDYAIGKAEAIRLQGACHDHLGDLEKALKLFNEALLKFQEIGHEKEIAQTYISIGSVYLKQNKVEKALEQYERALNASLQEDDPDGIVASYLSLSQISHRKSDHRQELKYLFEGMSYLNRCADQTILQVYLLNIGTVYSSLGEYEQALVYLNQVTIDTEKSDTESDYAQALSQISNIHIMTGQVQKAILIAEDALEIALKQKDKKLQANCLSILAYCSEKLKDNEKNLEYSERALQLYQQIGDASGEVNCMIQKASLTRILGDSDESDQLYRQAYALSRETNDRVAQIRILTALGASLTDQFKFLESNKHLELALELMEEVPYPDVLPEIYRLLADNYKQQRDFEKSLLYYQKYHDLTMGKPSQAQVKVPSKKEEPKPKMQQESRNSDEIVINIPPKNIRKPVEKPVENPVDSPEPGAIPIQEIKEVIEKSSEKKNVDYQLAQKIARIGSWHYSIENHELYISDILGDMLGVRNIPIKTFSHLLFSRVGSEDRKQLYRYLRDLLQNQEAFEFEFQLATENGKKLTVIAHGEPLYSELGEVTGCNGTLQDITDISMLEGKTQDYGSRLQTIVDALPDITFIFDLYGNYVDVMLSRSRDDYEAIMALKGKNIKDLCSVADAEKYMRVIRDTIRTEKMQIVEYQFDPIIERTWYEGRTALLKDERTSEPRVIWVARDITLLKAANQDLTKLNAELETRIQDRTADLEKAQTELEQELELRKQASDLLQQSVTEQKALFSVMPAIVYYKDKDLRYITANQAFCDLFRVSPEEVSGLTDFDLFPPEIAKEIQADDRKILSGGEPLIESVKKYPIHGGEYRWFSTSKTTYRNEQGDVVALVEVSSDVTDIKNKEAELTRLFTAIEQSAGTVCITDAEGNITYVNPAFQLVTGYSKEESIGKNPRFLQSGKHDNAFYLDLWKTINDGQVWKGVFTNQRKDGLVFEEEATISPVKDESGNIVSFVKVSRDVTKEHMLMLQLRQSQKMEAIGTLAGGIAHDFNNILGAIMGYSELISDDLLEDSTAAQNMHQVMTAIDRARDLVNQILTFSKMTETQCVSLQLQPIIKDVIKLLRASVPSTIEIRQNIDETAPTTYADPSQIHQILMNLCTNAAAAMQDKGGVLTIGLEKANMSERFFIDRIRPNGTYLKLTVSDTGVGIPQSQLERVFDPFFTTKAPGVGTGLGLSVVHGIVTGYGGKVFVESTEGAGTTFTIFLKTDKKPIPQVEAKPQLTAVPTGREHIMVVDDEAFIIDIMKQTLTRLGYEVTAVNDSQTALSLLMTKTKHYDLLITDLTMPGMTGTDLAALVKKERPELPIVLCSGFNELAETDIDQLGISEILKKPIDRFKLAEVTRKILDKDKSSVN
ncbi:MAG TPA: PAS domain S-box protein [Candidatus Cloacimonadota bacterium]|nr:PAS domain S-box protein [Candidatus Cloacimonadota bacterium]HPT72642.1 PAS domain S-box protein [Candidatus Cloacimonadota bacterium]